MISVAPNQLNWILRAIPNFCWPIKIFLIKKSLKRTGKKFRLGPRCQLFDHRLIEIGDNVFLGDGTIITTVVNIWIGNNVMFGPEVMIIGGDHNIRSIGIPMSDVNHGGINIPIKIENDIWIGARTIVLKGVKIREGAVIGAGSLVNKDILPYSINVGNPAKCVRCRFSREELSRHLKAVNSLYSLEEIIEFYHIEGKTL